MPTPLEQLPPVVTASLRRYLSYRWGNAIILDLI